MEENVWQSKYLMVHGIRTHYLEAGKGDPVVFVHGGGPGASGEYGWRNNIPALARHFHVYAIDMIGFGETDKPPIQYSHQVLVNHLEDFIETLCLTGIRIIGNSMGAYVAIRWGLDNPDRIKKAYLVASGTISDAMGVPSPLDMPGRKALAAYDGSKQSLRNFLEAIVHNKAQVTDDLVDRRYRLASLPGAFEVAKSLGEYQRRLRAEANQQQLFSLRHRLPMFQIPMRFVWGKDDTFAPVTLSYELEKLLPNIKFEVIERAGHQVMNDAPEEFNRRAVEFFLSD